MRFLFKCDHQWLRLAGSRRLHAEPHGGEDSDGCFRCYGTNVRPFAWSWLQPFTTAGVGGLRRTKAYGHRRQPARVLPSTSNFPLTMAGPREGSGRRLAGAAAAGEGQAAHRGRVRDRPESRGPCAADEGTAARRPPVLRHFLAFRC